MRCLVLVLALAVSTPYWFAVPARAEDCTSAVAAAFEKLRNAQSFRMETKITNAQGRLNLTVDFMPPDRMHQKVRLDDQAQEMELIVIGDKAWSNQGQGWVALPENFATEVAKQVKATMAGATKAEAKYECGADEAFEGRPAASYVADLKAPEVEKPGMSKSDTPEPAGPANKQTLYIDKETGLPVRNVVTDGKDASKRLFDGWFRMASGIAIEPPKTTP